MGSLKFTRNGAGESKPWRLILFGIIINLMILYYIFLDSFFIYISIVFAVILLVVIINNLNKRDKEKFIDKKFQVSIRDNLGLIKQYFFKNKKFIIASSVGLIITLLVISQSAIISASYRQYAFDDYLSGSDTRVVDFEIRNADINEFDYWNTNFEDWSREWITSNGLDYQTSEIYGVLNIKFMMDTILEEISDYKNLIIDNIDMKTNQWTPEFYSLMSQLPTFPEIEYNSNETILVLPSDTDFGFSQFYSIDKDPTDFVESSGNKYNFNILVDRTSIRNDTSSYSGNFENYNFNNISYEVDHYWKFSLDDAAFIRANNLNIPKDIFRGTLFLPNTNEWDMYNKLISASQNLDLPDYSGNISYIWGTPDFAGYLKVDIPLISEIPVDQLGDRIKEVKDSFLSEISNRINLMSSFSNENIELETNYPLENILELYLDNEDNLHNLMQLFTIPVLIISVFLFYFALSIIDSRKKDTLQKMKLRGATNNQLKLLIYMEILFYSIFAPILGIIIAIPLSSYFLSNPNIMNINFIQVPMIIPSDIFYRVPIIGALIALDFNLFNLHNIKNISQMSSEILNYRDTPFWEKSNLDVLMFIVGGLYWLIVPFYKVSSGNEDIFYRQLGYVGLGLIIIGLPLVVSRYFIGSIEKLVQWFPIKLDTVNLAIKGINRNKQFTTKLIALLLITMMFSFIGIITSSTYITLSADLSYYRVGSDLYVSGIDQGNLDDWQNLQVDGVEQTSQILDLYYVPRKTELRPGEKSENALSFHFMGIDPETFGKTSYWKDFFSDQSLKTILESLVIKNSIYMHSPVADILDLSENDRYNFLYGTNSENNYSLFLEGTVEYFPRLIFDSPSGNSNPTDISTINIITSIDTIKAISQRTNRPLITGAIVKTDHSMDQDQIIENIYTNLYNKDISVISANKDKVSLFQANENIQQNPISTYEILFIASTLSIIMLLSMVISLIGIGYYSFIVIHERKREIGVYRALGMVKNQIIFLLITELIVIITISLFLGSLAGLFISQSIFGVITGSSYQSIPLFRLIIPHKIIIGFNFVIGAFTLLMAIFPAIRLARGQTGNILREQ